MTSIRFFSISEQPAPELTPENTTFFQDHSCDFSILEMLTKDTTEINVEFFNNNSGAIECFGKNFWFEYQPAKLLENGWKEFEEAKIRIWINTNINLDLNLHTPHILKK